MIEAVVSVSLFGLLVSGLFGFLISHTRSYGEISDSMEKREHELVAVTEVLHLVKTGRTPHVSPDGKRLSLDMFGNEITIYPRGRSLLVRHRGASNPIAEGLAEDMTHFEIVEDEDGKKQVVVTLGFANNGKTKIHSFTALPLCAWD